MRRKSGGKEKKMRYIEVEGVKNEYLDAALLNTCSEEALTTFLKSEPKLIKKSGLTIQELNQNTLEYNEIIQAVSPHLLESYTFYNFLANRCEKIHDEILFDLFEDAYKEFTHDELESAMKERLLEEELTISVAINVLRFYKNGEFKQIIHTLLHDEDCVLKYYDEFEIKIEGFDLEWDEMLRQKYEGLLGLEDFKVPTDSITENGLNASSKLKIVLKMLNDVASEIDDLDNQAELQELLSTEQERVMILTKQQDELKKDLKSKETQIKSLNKENRALVKQLETANQKVEQNQKEVGRLGQVLGESRKQQEDLEQLNNALNRKVTVFEVEKNSLSSTMRKEFEKSSFKLVEREESLKKQLLEQENLLNVEKEKNAQLSEAFALFKAEAAADLEKSNEILEALEIERNKLVSQLNNVSETELTQVSSDESVEEDPFDFDPDSIGDFINFDNKPTRN
ncbi:hypothetical protein [Exiguobacterium sp. s37]|uniref:coiled-coil domain-containing protein n=1 Tax=Exiguobacterium sp. s37 TaxID=2751275 RepID=UPI001BE53310|nr:hypothetical protein [Exiguobacterium sp. s37]